LYTLCKAFQILFESSDAAKKISHLIDGENRKRANFVYDLDTRGYGMFDRIELLQVRQHTGIQE